MRRMYKNSMLLAVFLLGLLCGLFAAKELIVSTEVTNQQSLLLTEHCLTDFNQSLEKLKNNGYKVDLYPVNYRFNEYQKVKTFVQISHETLSPRIIESAINGIFKNCSTNSIAEFDVFDNGSMDNFIFYIRQLLTDNERVIILEARSNKVYLKSKQ